MPVAMPRCQRPRRRSRNRLGSARVRLGFGSGSARLGSARLGSARLRAFAPCHFSKRFGLTSV